MGENIFDGPFSENALHSQLAGKSNLVYDQLELVVFRINLEINSVLFMGYLDAECYHTCKFFL